jgi:hypothetical protein
LDIDGRGGLASAGGLVTEGVSIVVNSTVIICS